MVRYSPMATNMLAPHAVVAPRPFQGGLTVKPRVSRIDLSIEWAFALVLGFMPFAIGVTARWSEEVALAGVTALALLLLLSLIFRREQAFVWSWSYVIVLLFIVVAAGQLLNLPTALIRAVSPNTFITRNSLLGDLAADGHPFHRMPISFCKAATRHDLMIVLLTSAVFVITLNIFRRADQIKRLLVMLTIIGGSVVLLALAQDFSDARAIYWQVQTTIGTAMGGPFVNHNDFAEYANLGAGAILALLLVHAREVGRGKLGGRVGFSAASLLSWALCGLLLAAFLAVVLSESRGGVLATLIALGFTIAMLATTRGNNWLGVVIAFLGIAGFGFVLYFGVDAIYDRFASANTGTYGGREYIFNGVVKIFREFPSLGTGLGTHQFMYPMVDMSASTGLPYYAENEYLQLAEEMGVVGLALLGGFLCFLVFHYLQNARRNRAPIGAATFGMGFGLVAVMVNSASDFGEHFPSVGCFSAVSCAVLLTLSQIRKEAESAKSGAVVHRPLIGWRVLGCAVMAIVVAALVYELPAADRARRAETEWTKVEGLEGQMAATQWNGSERDYSDLLLPAAAAVDLCPDNVRYAYWLNSYRWHSVETFYDRQAPEYAEFAGRVVTELDRSRILGPTFGPIYSLSGQLQMFALHQVQGAEDIRKGYRLAPNDASCCFAAGRLYANSDQWDESLSAFTKAIKLDSNLSPAIMDVYLSQARRPDLAITLLHDDWNSLFNLAEELGTAGESDRAPNPELAALARKTGIAALEKAAASPTADAGVVSQMADVALQRGDYANAAAMYRRAISMNYANPDWHFQLARSLAKLGQGQSAFREAHIAIQIRPGWTDASRLVEELSKLPGVHTD